MFPALKLLLSMNGSVRCASGWGSITLIIGGIRIGGNGGFTPFLICGSRCA